MAIGAVAMAAVEADSTTGATGTAAATESATVTAVATITRVLPLVAALARLLVTTLIVGRAVEVAEPANPDQRSRDTNFPDFSLFQFCVVSLCNAFQPTIPFCINCSDF